MTSAFRSDTFAGGLPLEEAVRRGVEEAMAQLQAATAASAVEKKTLLSGARPIRDVLRARSIRNRFFEPGLFADPAWDMLLELYASSIEQRRVSVTSIGLASGVPPTTALRWMNNLIAAGLIRREDDPLDRRRTFVELSHKGMSALDAYFAELSVQPRVI